MVAEIGDHFHPTRFPAHFLSPRNAGKALECVVDLCFRYIVKSRCRRCHRRVAHIEFTYERNFERFLAKFEPRATGRVSHLANPMCTISREANLDKPRDTICTDYP